MSALSEAGEVFSASVLDFISNYKNETDYTVWVELASGLGTLKNIFYGEPFYGEFEKFAREIFTVIGRKLGWKQRQSENHTAGLLRSLVLNQLIGYNHKPTIDGGIKIYQSEKNIPADVRAAAYHARASTGSVKDHRRLIKQYQTENLSEEKNRLGRALGQFKDQKLLQKTLEFALSSKVRIQDTAGLFAAVWANPLGSDIAWQFTKNNWNVLLKRYPASGHALNRFVKMAAVFTTSAQAKDVLEFFNKHPAPGAGRSVSQVLEKINSNAAWFKRDAKPLGHWLKKIL